MSETFPIRSASSLPPGQVGGVPGSFAATAPAEAFGAMGSKVEDIADNIHKRVGLVEYAEIRAENQRLAAEMQQKMAEQTNEGERNRIYEDYRSQIENNLPSNGYALRLDERDKPFVLANLDVAKLSIDKQHADRAFKVKMVELRDEFVRTGQRAGLTDFMDQQVADGDVSPEEEYLFWKEAERDRTGWQLNQDALNDPDKILKLGTLEKMQKAYPVGDPDYDFGEIDASDWQRAMSLAQHAKARAQYQAETAWSEMVQDYINKANNFAEPIDTMLQEIKNRDDLTEAQKKELQHHVVQASGFDPERENPYYVTQDPKSFSDRMMALHRGEKITVAKLQEEWMSGPNNTPIWSTNEYQHLYNLARSLLESPSDPLKFTRNSDQYKEPMKKLQLFYSNVDKDGYMTWKSEADWHKYMTAYPLLERVIVEQWNQPGGPNEVALALQYLTVGMNSDTTTEQAIEDELVVDFIRHGSPLTPPMWGWKKPPKPKSATQQAKEIQATMDMEAGKPIAKIHYPRTQAEFEKLKVGDWYYNPTLRQYVRKQKGEEMNRGGIVVQSPTEVMPSGLLPGQ